MRVERKLLEAALVVLKLNGAYPFMSKWFLIIPIVGTVVRILIIFLAILMIALDPSNIDVFVKGMETLVTFIQGIKILPVLFFRKELISLIYQIDRFWVVENDFSFLFKMIKSYNLCIYSTLSTLYVNSLINKQLLFQCYVPNFPGALTSIMLMEFVSVLLDAFSVVGLDLLFIGLCAIIKEQMRMLIIKMEEIETAEDDDKLVLFQKWVDHHNFIKEYIEHIEGFYTHLLMMQYVLSTYALCVELFQMSQSNEASTILAAFAYSVTILFEISLYCFSAEEITTMSVELSDAAYNMKWYNLPVNLQKNVQIIICCTTKPMYIRALNIVSINRQALTTIFQGALSFYTLIQQVQEK